MGFMGFVSVAVKNWENVLFSKENFANQTHSYMEIYWTKLYMEIYCMESYAIEHQQNVP